MPGEPIQAEAHVCVGEQLREKRLRMGWALKYAAARVGLSEDILKRHEAGLPIAVSRYRRAVRIYNRAFYLMTQGMARQSKGVFR